MRGLVLSYQLTLASLVASIEAKNFWQVTYKYLNSTNQNWNTKFFDSLYYFPDNFIKILQNIVKRPIQKVDIDI